jgi:uncharacterized protein YbjT (DUF2867 family)
MTQQVAVIGAGGHTGRHVVADLARRGIRARGLVHSERSAEIAREAGAADVVSIDLDEPDSLRAAVTGCDTLVFIAPPFDAGEEAHAAAALRAATASHVGHFVYYSVLHANLPDMPHHVRKLHAESLVRRSSPGWTIIQPAMYQQSLLRFVQAARDGVVRLPFRLTASFQLVDLRDVAEVIGQVCAEPGEHLHASYELAGPERMTAEEMIQRVGQATGEDLRAEHVSPLQWPLPPELPLPTALEMLTMFAHYDGSGYPGNPTVLKHLLGRVPTPLATTARREL